MTLLSAETISKYYFFIQCIGFLGTAVYFLSFQFKENRKLFRCQFLSYLFYTIHLFLLGATTGALSYLINLLRSFFLGSDNENLKDKNVCCILCILQLITACITWGGMISVLPVTANIASTIAGYTYNGKKIRGVGMFINSPLWIIYNIIVGSWAGIADEVVSELSMIISIIRYGWNGLDGEME